MNFTTFIEIEVTVEYKHHKAYRGYRNSFGAPEEPDEPASIEIEEVFIGDKAISTFLSEEQLSNLQEEAEEDYRTSEEE